MENLKIKNKNIDGKQKTRYKINLVYQETYTEGTNIYTKYNMPLKLAETYSAGTAYIIAKSMSELYSNTEHADYIEIN